jgi:neutral ceramidase
VAGAPLRAGAARVGITPPIGTWQGGFGARKHPCEGMHDELYARAVVLEGEADGSRVAIVAADLLGLEVRSAQRIRTRPRFTSTAACHCRRAG